MQANKPIIVQKLVDSRRNILLVAEPERCAVEDGCCGQLSHHP